MKRTGHIRERSPGSFELRYSLGTDPATGKRKVVTAAIRGSRKDAEKELRRLLRSLDTGEHVDPNRITVREWLATWLAAVHAKIAPKTHERYGEIVNPFPRPRAWEPATRQTRAGAYPGCLQRLGQPAGAVTESRAGCHR